jgi:MYXO-CTERM domain-containing protein
MAGPECYVAGSGSVYTRAMLRSARRALLSCCLLSWASAALARDVPVDNTTKFVAAIADARAGDVIILAPGTYAMTGASCSATGTASEPIVVKSATPLAAKLRLNSLEGFKVTGAHWHFEGLDVTGVCPQDDACEHAFHVTGAAAGFVLRDSRVFDFNAQLKVNSAQVAGAWRTPHGGLVEGNELADSHARNTSSPTTKLNIDTGDDWIVRANYIHDAHKAGGDTVSYAAFMKSGGRGGLFERNLVICSRDDTTGGVRIGLSFGGGGTGAQFCAPSFDAAVPCDPEHTGGTMKNNIIIACSDVGIYLNKARDTKLLFNTLIATSGIDFRFASSTGEADGNVLTGKIRAREGGTFVSKTNLTDVSAFDSWYVAPSAGDLTRKGDLAALLLKADARAEIRDDYCARTRVGAKLTLGALEHSLGDCDTTRPWAARAALPDAGTGEPRLDAGTGEPLRDAGTGELRPDAGGNGASDAGAAQMRQDAATSSIQDRDAISAPSGDAAAGVRRDSGGCSTSDAGAQGGAGMLVALAVLLRRRRPVVCSR